MEIQVLRTLTEIEPLAEEWNHLLSFSASDVPFLRHEFLTSWWRTLGGGEWSQGELYVVTGRSKSGKLIGIAPLFFADNLYGEPSMMFLGSIEISDYLDLIACPEHLSIFLGSLFEELDSSRAPAWKTMDFYNLLDASPTLHALSQAAIQRGWDYSERIMQRCPYITLPGNWGTYLSMLEKKQRHEIRRKVRRFEQLDLLPQWYIVKNGARLEAEADSFLELMAKDKEKRKFLTEVMWTQMRNVVEIAHRFGWLQLAFLQIGNEKIAAYLNFDYNNRIWVYNSGLDFEYRDLSPGWVLLTYLLQWANENQRQVLDFMRGNEDYKYRFGAIDRGVVRAKITR